MIALALSGCGAEATDSDVAVAEEAITTSFVKVVKDGDGRPRFDIGGKPSRIIGANIGLLHYLSLGEIRAELDYAKNAGVKVVRVSAFDDKTSADLMAAKLKTALDEAQARGLYLSIALTGNYLAPNWATGGTSSGSVPSDNVPNGFTSDPNGFYSRVCGPHRCLSDAWLDWGYGAYYKGYAIRVASLLKDHPAVFSWDIANEVAASTREPWLVDILTRFYVNMAATLKQADPNHMVTTGLISTSWAGMQDPQRDQVYNSPNIDYLTVHEYDGADSNVWNNEGQDDDVWRANRRYLKPVIVEEIGAYRADDTAMKNAISAQYTYRLNPSNKDFEATGIMQFGVSSYSWYRDSVWYPDRLSAWFPTFLKGWSDKLAEEGSAPACGKLFAGGVLNIGTQLDSCDKRFLLAMQSDGNLVLYQRNVAALWSTATNGKGGHRAVMQTDGNFVLYKSDGTAIWNSGTWNHPGASLTVRSDGNLVVSSSTGHTLWSSGTCCR
ncbi:cellulase family glycosylhydrolase [Sorangium sp. So ce269]